MKAASQRRGPGRPPGSTGQQGRQALLDAARELLTEQGQSGVTLRAVAERADVRPTLANYYFGGKAGLLRAVTERIGERMRDRMTELVQTGGTPEERVRRFIHMALEIMSEDEYAPRLFVEQVLLADDETTDAFASQYIAPNIRDVASLMSEGQASGAFRELDMELLVPTMMGMVTFFLLAAPLLRRVFELDPFDPQTRDRYADFVADMLLQRLRSDEARNESTRG